MRVSLNIIIRELRSYFASPTAYVFIVIFLMLTGAFTFLVGNFFGAGQASMRGFFRWIPWLFLVLIPAIGMPMWSEERRLGTIELLFTMPVTVTQCVIGKFVAAWLFIGLALVLTFPMVCTVAYLGDPDYGVIVCGYAGSFLLAGTYLSVACMTSAMARSQVVSFIVSALICLFFIFAGWKPVLDLIVNWAPSWLMNGFSTVGVMPHFTNIQRGILDTRDIVYYLSVMAFCLFTSGILLKNHRAG